MMQSFAVLSADGIEVPMLGMMLLTLLVWIYMYVRRLGWIFAHPDEARHVTTPAKLAERVPERVNNSSDNLKNLFELPVLFYALCLLLIVMGRVDDVHVWCAWGFFALRAAHSAVQCTVNVLRLRFGIYLAGSICLWVMVVRGAMQIW